MPQYLLLIYGDPAEAPAGDDPAQFTKWTHYSQALVDAGVMQGGNALDSADTATTVRVRDDETLISDGPFAETKEILGGYYLIDVPDLDAALAWAAKMPNITYGSVEVRPIWAIPDAPPQ
ncbi:MAG: hypothetical protein QOG15_2860 [Solirubrobacteraceae bacterium]|jgi:hypothetical protein|nr:hypothetical protein [Solirubrobacteraceae bacterium]